MLEDGRIAGLDRVGQRARQRTEAKPAESFAAGLIATVSGVALLAWAVRTSAVRSGVVGMVLTAVGLWLVNERVPAWAVRWPARFLAAAVVLLAVGAGTMALAFARDAAGVAGVALVLLMAGLLPAGALLRRATRKGWVWGAPVGLVVGLAAPWLPSRRLGLILAAVGLVLCRRGLRRALE